MADDRTDTGFKRFNESLSMTEHIERAMQHVGDLCAGRKTWRMCVPVQADDSDVLITGALRRAREEIERLTAIVASKS